jgi:16S rRNA (adenine1518-N6/adenine1519-N6)-dimethyltransferase
VARDAVSAAELRAILARHGLRAQRSRGQNFLVDDALAARLVELAGVGAGGGVLEIGTGLGVLTRALAARAARVVTLEVDSGIVRALHAEGTLPANVELIHGDALRVDLAALLGGLDPPLRVVANLPYSISAPVLRRLLELRDRLVDWSVMLQREVARRLVALPGSRDYGSLGVLHRLVVQVESKLELPPGCFYPVPRVRSSFLRIAPLARALIAPGELEAVEVILRRAFGMRRKTLANALRALAGSPESLARVLDEVGIDRLARAEQRPAESFVALARALRPRAA